MHARPEVLPPGEVDPKLLHRLFYVDQFCLFAAAIIALVNVFPGIFLQELFPARWLDMRDSCALMTMVAVTSLFLSEETHHKHWQWVGRIFGLLTIAIAAISLVIGVLGVTGSLVQVLNSNQIALKQGSLAFSAAAFLVAGIAIVLVSSDSSNDPALGSIADAITVLLSMLVLMLVSGSFFRLAKVPGASTTGLTSTPALWCLTLLTVVLILRRGERGFLSILWGYGTGSRIARLVAPFLFLFPLAREIMRARLQNSTLIPSQYAGAVLTSVGTIVGFVFLLFAARLINRMQEKIQSMTLRDELTGVHNVRGFYLLAEQAFRYSRRTQEPFGVLFVDMDNLKTINDRLGHSAGSVSLVETAKLLQANFRDTDIIGRVGGDEFIVAGQFHRHEMEIAMERLREAAARKNQAAEHRFLISLSMGCAVTDDFAHETLRNLVRQADEEMYEEKHAKKQRQAAIATQSVVPE